VNPIELLLLLAGVLGGAAVILGTPRRWRLGGLALAFLVQALLLWMGGAAIAAMTRLIAGWIACGILLVTVRTDEGMPSGQREGLAFRVLAVLLVAVAAGGLGLSAWGAMAQIPPAPGVLSGVWLGIGLLGLGLADEAFGAGASLLLAMAGFETAYGLMETSLAVLALLAGIQVGISLVISYMLDVARREEAETR
jgi:hypothetical protein